MAQGKTGAKRKVAPYPFPVNLQIDGRQMVVNVVRLSTKGFIANIAKNVIKVGNEGTFNFNLPVMKDFVQGTVKVMRTFDQAQRADDKNSIVVHRLIEVHFVTVNNSARDSIGRFIAAIGQE